MSSLYETQQINNVTKSIVPINIEKINLQSPMIKSPKLKPLSSPTLPDLLELPKLTLNRFSPLLNDGQVLSLKNPSPISSKKHNLSPSKKNDIQNIEKEDLNSFFSKDALIIPIIQDKKEVKVREKIITEGNFDDIDIIDSILFCNQNIKEMYKFFDHEELLLCKGDFMKDQIYINNKMFEILIDWLVEVCLKLQYVPEVLYITVQVIKEYISKEKNIKRNKLQLVGITALYIVGKYEETYYENLSNYIYSCDKAYTKKDILNMEFEILLNLNFKIPVISSHTFICRYLKAGYATKNMIQLACYITERMLQDVSFHNYLPSEQVAASVFLARKYNENVNVWTTCLIHHTNYTEEHISVIADKIEQVIKTTKDSGCTSVYKKYSREKFGKVAQIIK